MRGPAAITRKPPLVGECGECVSCVECGEYDGYENSNSMSVAAAAATVSNETTSTANPPGVRTVCQAASLGRVYARRVAVANWQSYRPALWL